MLVVLILVNASVFCIHGAGAEAPVKVVEDCWNKKTTKEKVICFLEKRDELDSEEKKLILNIIKAESDFRNIQSQIINNYGEQEKSYGIAQIHLPSHNITLEQAYNIEFSVNFIVDKYIDNQIYLWTTYKKINNENHK